MFNEDKAFKLFIDGEIQGVVRIVREPQTFSTNAKMYVCVFVGKDARKDSNLCACLIQSLLDELPKVKWFARFTRYIVYNFDYDKPGDFFGFAMPEGNSSVVPGEAWF